MLVGKELGPYLVDKELGSGAMGTVFRAKHKKSGERVAIKLMSPSLGSSENALKRFKREVDILKQLAHPNIVRYIGSGRYHGSPFCIMEYVEGEALDQLLYRRIRLPWEEIIDLGVDLCAALQHAHDKGIIHRDLKPSNLMILKDGAVKLADFGIAKDTDVTALTAANSTVGTAAYMSPEQCRGVRDISHKTDLYSMGIMFYELLTGRKPFLGETAMEVFLQHANKTDYKRPAEIVLDVPIWLNTLVDQLMEKDPAKRPINADAVADALRRIKEKVEAKGSAGIEAATKRRIDRTGGDKKLDEDDKEAARAMLGKKKKKKEKPFYTKGWFTILALMLVASAISILVYFAFIKTPSAESLYAQAKTLTKSDAKAAREGPIADFLRYYPDHPDRDMVTQMQRLADQYDFELRERQMLNRYESNKPFDPEDRDEEQLARKALDDEKLGDLKEAAVKWKKLSAKKGSTDANLRAWGLVGERYGQDIDDIDAHAKRLKIKLDENAKPSDELDGLALAACKEELAIKDTAEKDRATQRAKARDAWDRLKRDAGKHIEDRPWRLLADRRLKELK